MSESYEQYVDRFLNAAAEGDVKTIQAQLKGAVDVNIKNAGGWTALMFAARNGHPDTVKFLLEKGSDTNIINTSGQTATDIARFWNHQQVVDVLQPPDSPHSHHYKHNTLVNFFGNGILDRIAHRRKDESWLEKVRCLPTTKYILLSDLQPVVVPLPNFQTKDRQQKVRLLTVKYEDIETHLKSKPLLILLGQEKVKEEGEEGAVWFAVDSSAIKDLTKLHAQAEILSVYPGMMMMLQEKDAGVVAQARSLMAWHDRNQFCSACGSQTTVAECGYKRACGKEDCICNKGIQNISYPRVDPTVIMAVVSQDRKKLLLGRGAKFPKGMFSCLAGFIEPGETIEDAARREVEEESGVKVGLVEYHSCQPWPMPSSLMIGCIAFAVEERIKVDKEELEEARWFSRNDVVLMMNRKHPQNYFVPPEQAIAYHLIRAWVSLTSNL